MNRVVGILLLTAGMLFASLATAQVFFANTRTGRIEYARGSAGLTAQDAIAAASVGGNLLSWAICMDAVSATQGSSIGAASASTDISGGTDTTFKVTVDGGTQVDVTLTVASLNTGALIAAAMETGINAAIAAEGGAVSVIFDDSDDHYEIYSRLTGTSSTVAIADGAANNVADDLKIGTANGGTEVSGSAANGGYLAVSKNADPSSDGIRLAAGDCHACSNCSPKTLKDTNVVASVEDTGYVVIQWRQ